MFAINPSRSDGWFVVEGERARGPALDLLRDGAPVSFAKPPNVGQTYRTARWRRFFMDAAEEGAQGARRRYAAYLCRRWNAGHGDDERIATVRLTFMHETTRRDFAPATAVPQERGQFSCP